MKKIPYMDWIKKGDEDLDTVKVLINSENRHNAVIGFHCQQAVEKYLKAFLVSLDIEKVPFTHDLDLLLNKCIENNAAFKKLDRIKISSLTSFAVELRYPDFDSDIMDDEITEIYSLTIKVKDFVLSILK